MLWHYHPSEDPRASGPRASGRLGIGRGAPRFPVATPAQAVQVAYGYVRVDRVLRDNRAKAPALGPRAQALLHLRLNRERVPEYRVEIATQRPVNEVDNMPDRLEVVDDTVLSKVFIGKPDSGGLKRCRIF